MDPVMQVAVTCANIEGLDARPMVLSATMDAAPGDVTIQGVDNREAEGLILRLKRALDNCWFAWPQHATTVSLNQMPAVVEEATLGLPLAAALIALVSDNVQNLEGYLFIGGVAESGLVTAPRGLVSVDALCRRRALTLVTGPGELSSSSPWHAHRFITTLASLARPLRAIVDTMAKDRQLVGEALPDFAGFDAAEYELRALVVACAGRHSLAFSGGGAHCATDYVRRIPSILSPLTGGEREIVERVTSAAGESIAYIAAGRRPLRVNAADVSFSQMVGGGCPVVPGEVSLATDGVLFLREVNDFNGAVLQGIRKAYIDKNVRIERAEGTYIFPADFMLVVSTTGDADGKEDVPASLSVLNDLIDMHVRLGCSDHQACRAPSSSRLASVVARARAFRVWRLSRAWEDPNIIETGAIQGLVEETVTAIDDAVGLEPKSAVVRNRIERLARTIADVEESQQVRPDHVFEAVSLVNR